MPTDPEASDQVYERAAEQLRSTARWLLTALAAVGGALLTGVQISGLQGLNAGWHLSIAVMGVMVSLSGVGYLLNSSARIFTQRWIMLSEIQDEDLDDLVARRSQRLATGDLSLAARLRRWHYDRQLHQRSEALIETLTSLESAREELYGHVAANLGQLYRALLDDNREHEHDPAVRQAIRAVVAYANYIYLRQSFRRFRLRLLVVGALVVGGVLTYALALGTAP